jgi:peptidoglycan/LPS O-acetylase OafA/YrhL
MRVPVYLGRISFALYLLHFPLVMSFMLWAMYLGLMTGVDFGIYFTVAFALFGLVLWGLAELFTRWVDVPSIRLAWRFDKWLTRSGEVRPRPRPSVW